MKLVDLSAGQSDLSHDSFLSFTIPLIIKPGDIDCDDSHPMKFLYFVRHEFCMGLPALCTTLGAQPTSNI